MVPSSAPGSVTARLHSIRGRSNHDPNGMLLEFTLDVPAADVDRELDDGRRAVAGATLTWPGVATTEGALW